MKNSLFSQKVTISERCSEIPRKFVSTTGLKSENPETNLLYVQSSKTGQILTKTVFLLKMSHIELNYAFLLF